MIDLELVLILLGVAAAIILRLAASDPDFLNALHNLWKTLWGTLRRAGGKPGGEPVENGPQAGDDLGTIHTPPTPPVENRRVVPNPSTAAGDAETGADQAERPLIHISTGPTTTTRVLYESSSTMTTGTDPVAKTLDGILDALLVERDPGSRSRLVDVYIDDDTREAVVWIVDGAALAILTRLAAAGYRWTTDGNILDRTRNLTRLEAELAAARERIVMLEERGDRLARERNACRALLDDIGRTTDEAAPPADAPADALTFDQRHGRPGHHPECEADHDRPGTRCYRWDRPAGDYGKALRTGLDWRLR